jgi:hypothetical protein
MGGECSVQIHSKFQLGHLMGTYHLGDLDAGRIIILQRILEK